MRYFSNFPKNIITSGDGNFTLATNLLARVNLIPTLINNPSLFYTYSMQDGDTPEIIATKYYDNPYRYWIFLYGNNIMDPQWDLPMSSNIFGVYLEDKYKVQANTQTVLAYTQSTVKYYMKVVETYDSETNTTTKNEYNVDQDTYNNLPSNSIITKTFPDGSYVQITQTKYTVSIYDYEISLNEAKREVKVINKLYAGDMEEKLKSLMSE